jgi:hypothetical protein
MKRMLTTWVMLFAVTTARADDIATTLHFNLSLSREDNPKISTNQKVKPRLAE